VSHDEKGFAEFFLASWDPGLRAVAASTGDMLLAEDQVAEAFARAWVSWRKVSRHPAPRAWGGAHRAPRRGVLVAPTRPGTALANHDVPAPGSPGTGLDTALLTALRRLPARQREVIVLRVFLDLDIETTARQLAIAPGPRVLRALHVDPRRGPGVDWHLPRGQPSAGMAPSPRQIRHLHHP
jgi:DNA-directed RNA polymerase specialized sigma24 family protein